MILKSARIGLVGLCLVAIGACGGGELDPLGSGCRSDDECKHGRICVEGWCVDSSGDCTTGDDCPEGHTCYLGHCLICDQDGDGAEGGRCAGRDCDDNNSAIHPDATELCGDEVDNDCDGLTDPESICGALCAGVSCPDGYACDPQTGNCVLICTPDCEGRQCGQDGCEGVCGRCRPGMQCVDGHCVAGCQDRCFEEPERPMCMGNAVVFCDDFNNDGCREWSEALPCPEGTWCREGECAPCLPDCQGKECGDDNCGGSCGECPPFFHCEGYHCLPGCQDLCQWGMTRCADAFSFMFCEDFNGDGCAEWGGRERCPEGLRCDESTGFCGGECQDECMWGASQCTSQFSFIECSDFDGDPCSEWGPEVYCPDDQPCDPVTNRCGGGCWDECWWGESRCIDERMYSECGEWDGDPCTEFGPPYPCPDDSFCDASTGYCTGECWDECWWGESYCLDEMTYMECGEWDDDYCLEFSPPLFCGPDGYCDFDQGYCTSECWDDCWWGEIICLGEQEYMECGQYDFDPCADWSGPQRCAPGTWCSEQHGECVGDCQDECWLGESQCLDEWSFIDCGFYDSDPCLEWGYPYPCPPDMRCDFMVGYCVPFSSCEEDLYEPDNDRFAASNLSPHVPQTHSICPVGDQDWWIFTLNSNTPVLLETSGFSGDTVMWLFDQNLNQLGYDDDSGMDLFSRIMVPVLGPGQYYVRVQEYGSWAVIDRYNIDLIVEDCQPDCSDRECGPDPICGLICGDCPDGMECSSTGQCIPGGGKPGAGDPCGFYLGCPADWSAAYTCIEFPGSTDGLCSYPCQDVDECAIDFPNGCCRQLTRGYSACLPAELCDQDLAGFLEECLWGDQCMPDMFCIDNIGSGPNPEQICIFTCDLAMSNCPAAGTCIQAGDGTTTGLCLPAGDNLFGEPCALSDGCVSGLMCTPFHEDRPGYCNRLCSSLFPCPSPFQCIAGDGQGSQLCAIPCFDNSNCQSQPGWSCQYLDGNIGVCLPN